AIGAIIELKEIACSDEALLFGETPSRIIISFSEENLQKVTEIANLMNCPFEIIGRVGGDFLDIKVGSRSLISAKVTELEGTWRNALEKQLHEV
ncbi:MAG: phosphoribosylformylglycinamidine synthase II, partial [Acidobacteria bacterium]